MNSQRKVIAFLSVAAFVTLLPGGWSGPVAGEPGAPSRVRVGANFRMVADPAPARADDAPGLAVDPKDPDHIVVVNHEYRSQRCRYNASFDGGRSWESGDLRAPEGFEEPVCDPRDGGGYAHMNNGLGFGTDQAVYAAFSGGGPGGQDATLVARSLDGGRTFETAVVAQSDPVVRFTRPTLSVVARPEGDVVRVASWALTPAAGKYIAGSVSTDGGRTFEPESSISALEELARDQSQPVVIAGTDQVHVAYKSHAALGQTASLRIGSSTDGGRTWKQQTLGRLTGISEPHITMASDARDGTIYVTYQASFQGDNDIWLQRSTDGALTWSKPLRVNDDPAANRIDQCGPWVTVGADGIVHLIWYDMRHTEPGVPTSGCVGNTVAGGTGNKREDLYYAFSDDRGSTFSANHRITYRTINRNIGTNHELGMYWSPVAVPLPGSGLLTAWIDSRDGNFDNDNQDVYLARVELGLVGPPHVERLQAASLDELSVALSQRAYPGGREDAGGRAPATRVVVVDEGDAALATPAGVLARMHHGPLLVAGPEGLSESVRGEVRRLDPAGGFIIGDVHGAVTEQLATAGVPSGEITQMTGAAPAEIAAKIARSLDRRTAAQKDQGQPAFSDVVVVNDQEDGSEVVANLAAARHLPVLFVGREVPEATTAALDALDINRTLVVGDSDRISDAVAQKLPSPTRLSGGTPEEISQAVTAESAARGLPTNLVYITDSAMPLHAALVGAAVGRMGGLLFAAADSDHEGVGDRLSALGLEAGVDRYISISIGSAGAEVADQPIPRGSVGAAPSLPATGAQFVDAGAAVLLLAALLLLTLARGARPDGRNPR